MTALKAGERIDYLPGTALKIIQSDDTFALSTDTMLLARFAHVRAPENQRVLDFCTGTGAIPLLLSEQTKGTIDGLELQADIAARAQRSVALNGLSERIHIQTLNIRDAKAHYAPNSIDVVTCNPPYFKVKDARSLHSNQKKALARHELTMTLADVFEQASYVLRDKGKLFLVHRPERLTEIVQLGEQYQLRMKRLQFVHARQDKNATTVLIELMKAGQAKGLTVLPALTLYGEGQQYTDAARRMLYGE